jgi:hypothetical protein
VTHANDLSPGVHALDRLVAALSPMISVGSDIFFHLDITRAAPAERSEARQFLVLCKKKLGNSKSFQERSSYQTFLCDGQFISLTEY